MDVQGAEGMIIQGMPLLLQRIKNLKIITEFWPIGLKRCGIEPKDYLQLLENWHFKLYHMDNKKKRLEPVKIADLLKEYTPKNEDYTNLLCIR